MSPDERLQAIVDSFAGKRVLVVGDVMLDKYVWGSASRISPEAPVPVVRIDETTSSPGGAANVANNISALGGQCLIAGIIGSDEDGETLRELLEGRGIDCAGLIVDSGRPTTSKTRIIAHRQQVVRTDRESSEPLAQPVSRDLIGYIENGLEDIDAIVFSDYAKGIFTAPLCSEVIGAAEAAGRKVIVDPKPVNLRLFKGASVVTPNRQEALTAMGLSGSSEYRDVAGKMIDELDLEAALITLGEHGMYLLEKGGAETELPTIATDVFDVTGAGDTVVGTLSLALAAGASYREAVTLANLAAGIAVTHLGAVAVTAEQLREVL